MTDTICVLALDAADYRLVQRWGLDNLLLDEHQPIETFSWSKDQPYTPEVWATVATGVGPDEHGVGSTESVIRWDNPALRFASKFTQYLPHPYRIAFGAPFRDRGAGRTMESVRNGITNPFDATLSWPGLDDRDHLAEVWKVMDKVNRNIVSSHDADGVLYGFAGQELGWLQALSTRQYGLIGTHIHLLDANGHIHATDESRLRKSYEWINEQIGLLRNHCDRLVLLSDHGMQTSFLGDETPGMHSWESYMATQGIDSKLPDSVYDVRDFLERVKPDVEASSATASMDTPTEQLQNLGYLE